MNLWTVNSPTGAWRQITYERDPSVTLGVPIWSIDGKRIGFVSSRGLTGLAFGIWTSIRMAATCGTWCRAGSA